MSRVPGEELVCSLGRSLEPPVSRPAWWECGEQARRGVLLDFCQRLAERLSDFQQMLGRTFTLRLGTLVPT